MRVKGKDQYRLFWDDSGITVHRPPAAGNDAVS
jgi:hypothetical protein